MLVERFEVDDIGGSWNLTDVLRVLVVRVVDGALEIFDCSSVAEGGDGNILAAIVAACSLSLQTSLRIARRIFASAVPMALSILSNMYACVGRESAGTSVRNLALRSPTLRFKSVAAPSISLFSDSKSLTFWFNRSSSR